MNTDIRIIGKSSKVQEIMRTAALVSATDVPILISGETGTGKSLLAQKIHCDSSRHQGAFIHVNCAALDQSIAEQMLFGSNDEGHGENSGYIAQAHEGTLFLDGITELSLPVQAKLLRFLETTEVQLMGSSAVTQHDVRIIVASTKNIHEEVEAKRFRTDLFYRLNIIPLELPSLCDREEDCLLLIDHFFSSLVKEHRRTAPSFTQSALHHIKRYDWPGNIQELQNFCERMYLLLGGKTIDVSNLPHELRQHPHKTDSSSPFTLPATGIKLESVEIDLMKQALESTQGNKSRAAALLGLTRDTFLYRLRKYSLR